MKHQFLRGRYFAIAMLVAFVTLIFLVLEAAHNGQPFGIKIDPPFLMVAPAMVGIFVSGIIETIVLLFKRRKN